MALSSRFPCFPLPLCGTFNHVPASEYNLALMCSQNGSSTQVSLVRSDDVRYNRRLALTIPRLPLEAVMSLILLLIATHVDQQRPDNRDENPAPRQHETQDGDDGRESAGWYSTKMKLFDGKDERNINRP